MLAYVVGQHGSNCSVISLDLLARPRIVRLHLHICYPQSAARALEELGVKLRSVICHKLAWNAVFEEPSVAKGVCDGVRSYFP